MQIEPFLSELRDRIGHQHVSHDDNVLRELSTNTLGLERRVLARIRPQSTQDVTLAVAAAGRHGVPLYPISRGWNIGYGSKTPVLDDCAVLDLSGMNAIREYDPVLGSVVVEPGVSQRQLHQFLVDRNAPYIMDATGAGLEASIVGNVLEGGFGHTPYGNHREHFSDAEVVLGNGTVLRTGRFPDLGPDLKGIIVQSNFGVVTALRLPLLPRPAHYESFIIRIDADAGLEALTDRLRLLRQEGVVTSCVHMANATRYLVSSRPCPPEFADTIITSPDAVRIMSTRLLKVGFWNAAGGLYGLKGSVSAAKRRMREVFKGIGEVRFFSNAKLRRLMQVTGKLDAMGFSTGRQLQQSLESFKHIHELMQGVPTDEPYRNIRWRVAEHGDLGLIWFSPVLDATGEMARAAVELARPLFRTHGFEMPLTMTLVTPDRIVGIFNIAFDLHNETQRGQARELYYALKTRFSEQGIRTYRSALLGMMDLEYDEGKRQVLSDIKNALDPHGIIAPGRYAIDGRRGRERNQD